MIEPLARSGLLGQDYCMYECFAQFNFLDMAADQRVRGSESKGSGS
jgi:hypothetical protein